MNWGSAYEVAYARYGDRRYAELLNKIYHQDNTKRKLRWLFALNPELSDVKQELYPEQGTNFEQTGIGILRDKVMDDKKWLYLDYGIVGGEHGHPDRLSIGYYAYGNHWLLDPATRSYAFPNLQTWYRQTIAHNTIVVNETKQGWGNGYLRYFGESPGIKVVSGSADKVYGGVKLTRTEILIGDYFLDIFDTSAPDARTYDLPYHGFGTVTVEGVELAKQPIDLFGHKPGIQGYDQLSEVKKGETDNNWQAIFRRDNEQGMALRVLGEEGSSVYSAMTPGLNGSYDTRLPMVMNRRVAANTRFASLLEVFKGQPRVTAFSSVTDTDIYVVNIGDEKHTITADIAQSRPSSSPAPARSSPQGSRRMIRRCCAAGRCPRCAARRPRPGCGRTAS